MSENIDEKKVLSFHDALEDVLQVKTGIVQRRAPFHFTFDFLSAKLPYDSNCTVNLKRALAYADPNGSDSYDNWSETDISVLLHATNCCCSHDIMRVCTITHKTTFDTMDIGSECIEKFKNKRMSKLVRNAFKLLKDPGIKFCHKCDSKIQKEIIDQYPNQDKHYHKKCLALLYKKCLGCEKFINYDCKCILKKCTKCNKTRSQYEQWETLCTNCWSVENKKNAKTRDCNTCKKKMYDPEEWRIQCKMCWIKNEEHLLKLKDIDHIHDRDCNTCEKPMYNPEDWRKQCKKCWWKMNKV